MDIADIDKNLELKSSLKTDNIIFYNVNKPPFKIYGLYDYQNQNEYMRMPIEVSEKISEGVKHLNYSTAGGRLRFKTDSDYIAINVKMNRINLMPHMAFTGSTGFDLYIKSPKGFIFCDSFVPPISIKDGYESIIYFNKKAEKDILINFPLYSGVNELYIGLEKSATLKEGSNYLIEKPIVFYGSSITQGGCASRPGNSYQAILSSWLDCDYINLGFSGNAKGEQSMAAYISKLDMSVFVCDYDHNAPSLDFLEKTHIDFYKRIRANNKTVPIVLMSKPDFENGKENNIKRRKIIKNTYIYATESGDKNIYFVNGEKLFKNKGRDNCTVDMCHPNDLGFYRIAEGLYPVIKGVLSKN